MVLAMTRPWPHPKTQVFWFRKRVRESLRKILGKREEKFTLGTKDPAEAKRRHARAAAVVEERWANLKKGEQTLTFKQATALAGEFYRSFVRAHEDNPGPPQQWEPPPPPLRLETESGPITVEVLSGSKTRQWFAYRQWTHDLLIHRGILVNRASESFLNVVKALAKAHEQARQQLLRNSNGDYSPDPVANRFPVFEKDAVRVSLEEMWKKFIAPHGPATAKRWHPVKNALSARFGDDLDVNMI